MRRGALTLGLLLALAACQGGGDAEGRSSEDQVTGTDSGTDAQIVDSLVLAAEASQRSGDWQGAAQYWSSLAERDPDSIRYAVGLGDSLRHTGHYSDAVQVLRTALARHPDAGPLIESYGKALLAAGYREDALAALNQAAAADPLNWQVQSVLGIAYGMGGDNDLADQHYRQALALAPDNPVVLNNYALHLAITGRLDAGLALMEQAAGSLDATTQVRQNLALLLAIKGDFARAEQIVRTEMPGDAADRQMAFLHTLSSSDLADLGEIINQAGQPIYAEALPPAVATGNVADLTNLDETKTDFLVDQPDTTVIETEALLVTPPLEAAADDQATASVPEPSLADVMNGDVAAGNVAAPAETTVAPEADAAAEDHAALAAQLSEMLDGGQATSAGGTLEMAPVEEELPSPPPETAVVPAIEPPAPPPDAEAEAEAAVAVVVPESPAVATNLVWHVQIASLATEDAAERGRRQAMAAHDAVLGGQSVAIVAAQLDDGSTTWRVLAGAFADKASADALCSALRGDGGDCFVMKDRAASP